MTEEYVIWIVGPHTKPNVSLKTALALAHQIQVALNKGKDVVIKYKGNDEVPLMGNPVIW